MKPRLLIFGATGAIGEALCQWFSSRDWDVTAVSRSSKSNDDHKNVNWIAWDPLGSQHDCLTQITMPFDAIVWAQGKNCSDNVFNFRIDEHEEIYRANVTYILQSLQLLLSRSLLNQSARLCVISSIWQNIARQDKLSYTVSKAALQGLVQSLAIDLGKHGHLINAVLPGALDTPMTRANLTIEQIENLKKLSPLMSLATLDDVCGAVGFLCSTDNSGITGQFIATDRGFSNARIL